MAEVLQDQYILGHSETATISTIGQEVAIDLTLLPQPAVDFGSVSGIITDGENPIPGAYVKIMDSNYNPVAHTVTDNNGNYTFTTLTPNTSYYAFASATGYGLKRSGQFIVSTDAPTNIGTMALEVDETSTYSIIAGDLKDNTTNSPINGAVCYLYTEDAETQTPVLLQITYTNSYGQFVFRDLDTSTTTQYTVIFTALGYDNNSITTTISGTNRIVFVPDATMQPDGITSTGTISGMITDSNGIIANADVILYSVNNSTGELTPIAKTKTDIHGVYLFFNVSNGTYMVKSNKMAVRTVEV